MPKFKCIAPGCGLENEVRLPPQGCLDTRRCKFRSIDALSSTKPPGESAPAPETPPLREAPPEPPSAAPMPRGAPPSSLTAVIAGNRYTITHSLMLGRNGDLATDDFRKSLSVSREHCRIEASDSMWRIVAVSKSAPTSLNGILVSPGDPLSVPQGDSTLLLGESFNITLTLHDPAPPADEEAQGELDRLLRDKSF